jgi:hypothetical protein
VVAALLDSERLDIPPTIKEATVLGKELRAFRAKVTAAGNETMEADWRSRAHDDLVLALAIAAWLGEQAPPPSGPPFVAARGLPDVSMIDDIFPPF